MSTPSRNSGLTPAGRNELRVTRSLNFGPKTSTAALAASDQRLGLGRAGDHFDANAGRLARSRSTIFDQFTAGTVSWRPVGVTFVEIDDEIRSRSSGFWPKPSPSETPSTRMKISGIASSMTTARGRAAAFADLFCQRPDRALQSS